MKKEPERQEPPKTVIIVNVPPPKNALQSLSDWWHGGEGEGARSRHMRMHY